MLTLCWLKGKMQRLTKRRHDSSWSQSQRVQRITEFWASEDRVSRKDGGVSQEEEKCTLRDCFKITPTPASTLSTWKQNPCTATAAEQWHRMWIKSSGGPLLRAFHDRTNNLLKHGNTSEGCHPLWSATWISAVSRGYLECVPKQRTAAGLQSNKHQKKNNNDNSLLDLTFLLVLLRSCDSREKEPPPAKSIAARQTRSSFPCFCSFIRHTWGELVFPKSDSRSNKTSSLRHGGVPSAHHF